MDSIIAKINKLLALGERGGTEAEATAAMQKVHELLAKHNLSLDDVKDSPVAEEDYIQDESESVSRQPWQHHIWNAVAKLYFCRHLTKTGPYGTRHLVIGKASNVAVVKFRYYVATAPRKIFATVAAAILILLPSLAVAQRPYPIESQFIAGNLGFGDTKKSSLILCFCMRNDETGNRFTNPVGISVPCHNIYVIEGSGIFHQLMDMQYIKLYTLGKRALGMWQNGRFLRKADNTVGFFDEESQVGRINPRIEPSSNPQTTSNLDIKGGGKADVFQFNYKPNFSPILRASESLPVHSTRGVMDVHPIRIWSRQVRSNVYVNPRTLPINGSLRLKQCGIGSFFGISDALAHDFPLPEKQNQLANADESRSPASEYQSIREKGYSIGRIGEAFVNRLFCLAFSLLFIGLGTIWWGSRYLYGNRHSVGAALMVAGVCIGSGCYLLLLMAMVSPFRLLWLV